MSCAHNNPGCVTTTDLRRRRLCLAVIIALPITTPPEFRNTAKAALWDFTNRAWLLLFYAPAGSTTHATMEYLPAPCS